MKQLDLNDVRLLMHVIAHGNYTSASRATGVPKSTISQRIAALERAAGTGLLRRTSRSFSLTEAGNVLAAHARPIEELARKAEQAMFDHEHAPLGTLRVACSNAIGQFALSPLVAEFLARHAKVSIRVEASSRLVDLVSEGFDMAVRGHMGPLRSSTLVQRVVGRSPWQLVASPAWIALHGEPATPADIPADETLCFSSSPECPAWVLRAGPETVSPTIRPRLVTDDCGTLRAIAIAGGGIACLPGYIVARPIALGQLVPLLREWSPPASTISVLTPPRHQSSRLAIAFSDFLAVELPRVMRA